MARYKVKPKTYWSEDLAEEVNYPQTLTVIEVGEDHEDTGLVDADENPVFRVKDPIGFVHHD